MKEGLRMVLLLIITTMDIYIALLHAMSSEAQSGINYSGKHELEKLAIHNEARTHNIATAI
jgi:hypothetical protein